MVFSPYLFLFALVPIAHFVILYTISKHKGTLGAMLSMHALKYFDWLFVPFTVFGVVSVNWNWTLFFATIGIGLIFAIVVNIAWHKKGLQQKAAYFTDARGLTAEGWVHFLFMVLEGAIVGTVFLSKATSPLYYAAMACLFVYVCAMLYAYMYIHKKPLLSYPEVPYIALGGLLIVVRAILSPWL